jgi:inosose dehydratase
MSDLSRRAFLGLGVAAVAAARGAGAAGGIRVGYAAITWGGRDEQAIEDIADAGYHAIQLRATAVDTFGANPSALRDLLSRHGLKMAVLSSGNLRIDPAAERDQLALHTSHAEFVKNAGGEYLQVIDERPKGRAIVAEDYARLGRLLSELGRRTAAAGVPLVYHHHMNSLGEKPDEIENILEAADPAFVGVLFDIAHYQQGGGDPIAGIRKYRDRIKVVHLKDVETTSGTPGYRWVALGRGRVDVKGCIAALRNGGFDGWAIVELDRALEPETPKQAAIANREYVTKQLGLTL